MERLLPAPPMCVPVAELRVAVAAVGIVLGVLFPRQLPGHPLALEFLVDGRPLGYPETAGDASVGARIEQPRQPAVIQFRWQRPAESQRIGFAQQFPDSADTELGTGFDLADREPGGVA